MNPPYPVDIDFDEASREWRKNKRVLGGGLFEYKCAYVKGTGKFCPNRIVQGSSWCRYHSRPSHRKEKMEIS